MSEAVQCIEEEQEIATLAGVLDPVELRKHLYPVLPTRWGILRDIGVQALQHHRGRRCTVQITLQTTSGKHELIGKVYATDRADVYQVMNLLVLSGFGPNAESSIPQPLAYIPALHLLLQEKVQGLLAKEVFLKGNDKSCATAAERCARWLAHFHEAAPRSGHVFDPNNYLVSLERWSRRIAKRIQPLARKVSELYRRLETAASRLDSAEICAGHGSYNHSQIILAENRTVTFDWDDFCAADPSRDVARFMVALGRPSLGRLEPIPSLDAAAEIFQKTYLTEVRPKVLLNLPYYRAATCLQLAKYEVHHEVLGWRRRVEALIDEALRTLNK